MNAGLIARTLRETRLAIVLFALALMLVERLLIFVLPQIQQQAAGILTALPMVRSILSALLGVQVEDELTAQMLQSILWVHPVVLTLVWGSAIMLCTRFPAGEIDRGTIDVLLGCPVSRRGVYVAESIVWFAAGALIIGIGSLGYFAGAAALPASDRPRLAAMVLVMFNLFCVYLAVGGVAQCVSAMSDRRGRAVAVIIGMVVASFLLNFLAQFWTPARNVAFLGVLNYYQPARIMSSGAVDGWDIAVLLVVGAVAWIAGGEIIARRSICTT